MPITVAMAHNGKRVVHAMAHLELGSRASIPVMTSM